MNGIPLKCNILWKLPTLNYLCAFKILNIFIFSLYEIRRFYFNKIYMASREFCIEVALPSDNPYLILTYVGKISKFI